MTPIVSIIILNYNGREHLRTCLSSLQHLNFPKEQLEIILVDNNSTDGSLGFVKAGFPDVRLIQNQSNLGFARGVNRGAEHAQGKYLAFLNNDVRVERNWLSALVETARVGQGFACVGSTILNWDGTEIDFKGRPDDAFCLAYEPTEDFSLSSSGTTTYFPALFASGGALLVERAVFEQVGGLEPDFFLCHDDVDFGWRLWLRGHECVLSSESIAYHKGGADSDTHPRAFI